MPLTAQTTPLTLRLVDRFGTVLVGRDGAAELRQEIEHHIAAGVRVVLDFSEVTALAPSFADELLAKLPDGTLDGSHVVVEQMDPASAALAKMTIVARR